MVLTCGVLHRISGDRPTRGASMLSDALREFLVSGPQKQKKAKAQALLAFGGAATVRVQWRRHRDELMAATPMGKRWGASVRVVGRVAESRPLTYSWRSVSIVANSGIRWRIKCLASPLLLAQ